jgi:Transglutaminase-like superfamily
MFLMIVKAYLQLIRFEIFLAKDDFQNLCASVRNHRTEDRADVPVSSDQLNRAMGFACIWYWKEVLCLQRSAATTCLMRSHGIPAQLVIGVQPLPFKSHAWVEVNRIVVNDKAYVSAMYAALDRC